MNVMDKFSKWEYYVYIIHYIENNCTWVGNAQENGTTSCYDHMEFEGKIRQKIKLLI